ncbi:MAG: carboxypeptidase-like regulatory domain-containing protein [Bacteroidota bacterium]|nr:carboxypeptidase-like regulatory domain-containing protein [Bacteroidota bacterium]
MILIILFNNLGLNGQTRTITGRVVSEDLEALPDVNIQNSEKLLLAKTDLEGRFKINIQQETDRLIFSWIGMELTEIKLHDKCDTVEVVMMYAGTYDFMTLRKVDRLRKKRFDKLPSLHSDAVINGLFKNNNICYERIFIAHKPTKPVLDSLSKAYKSKRKQIKDTFKGLALGDTIRIPYSGAWREDGTDRTTLHIYSNGVDGEDFDCIIRVVIIDKNKRKGGYNLVCRVIDCKDCHYDNIVRNGKELKVGETIEFNMKYFKILKNK